MVVVVLKSLALQEGGTPAGGAGWWCMGGAWVGGAAPLSNWPTACISSRLPSVDLTTAAHCSWHCAAPTTNPPVPPVPPAPHATQSPTHPPTRSLAHSLWEVHGDMSVQGAHQLCQVVSKDGGVALGQPLVGPGAVQRACGAAVRVAVQHGSGMAECGGWWETAVWWSSCAWLAVWRVGKKRWHAGQPRAALLATGAGLLGSAEDTCDGA